MTLNDLKELLSNLARNSSDVYWLSSPDFSRIAYISPAYEMIWGRSRQELYAEPEKWITFLHPDDIEGHPIHEMRERVAKLGPKARYAVNYRVVRPDGDIRFIVDRGFPVYDFSGNCIGVTGVAVDVTHQKRVEEQKNKAENEKKILEKQIESLKMVADTLAHELRTPLGCIAAAANLILKRLQLIESEKFAGIREKIDKNLHTIKQEVANTQTFISIILENAKDIENVRLQVIGIAPSINKAIDNFPYSVNAHKDLIHVAYNSNAKIMGEEHLLTHVILNLLKNALFFIQKNGRGEIYIKVYEEDERIVISFEDTAEGVDEEHLPQLFENYYSNTGVGTGIGLGFCKRVVHAFNGKISCESEKGNFIRFIMEFPKI